MKKLLFLLLMGASAIASAQNITFADTNFRNALVNTLCVDIDGDEVQDVDADANDDGIIQLSEALAIENLEIMFDSIESLSGIENFVNLKTLNCNGNLIVSLDVHSLLNLETLSCDNNLLTSLNIQGLTELKTLICNDNQLLSLDVQSFINLEYLACKNNILTSINIQGLNHLKELYCSNNQLLSLSLQGVDSLQKIECDNNQLNSLSIQGLNNLNTISFKNNYITSFDPQPASELWAFNCSHNLIGSLNVQGLNNLAFFCCDSNLLTSLNIQGLTNLTTFYCNHNSINSLNFQGVSSLYYVNCSDNQISSINIDSCWVSTFDCSNNLLTTLNTEKCVVLSDYSVDCSNNQLISLFVKNGQSDLINFSNNPNLSYVCCDDNEISTIQNNAVGYGLTNCVVNSYCSFTPGGPFYNIQGVSKFDMDVNGCDANDYSVPNVKFQINNGSTIGTIISDTTGSFFIPLQSGVYDIKPIFDNSEYYLVDSVQVSLPNALDPYVHNFCIIPNGVHHDLEILIIPIIPPRPGFSGVYKILYKNNGTQIENGIVNFYYNDSLIHFASAMQTPIVQNSGHLSWDFINLLPFQHREIIFTMNCNGPTDIPSVNMGDFLTYNADIQGVYYDEKMDDNSVILNQLVVGAIDPNDKTCLEGNRITPSMVGNYIHYLIRFENTGTWAAENIVVKDILDTAVFDASTLLVTDASHNAYTRMTNGNQVEFIFENIQLPFDDAHNDGYIAFKIKTKADLVVGDSIKNIANIYFDYNLPIVTNEAQTTVQNPIVGIEESLSSSVNIELFPNPVVDVLSFKTDLKIDKIEIYDLVGRLVQALDVEKNQVKIEELPSGTYLIKLHASGKAYFSKVVKK